MWWESQVTHRDLESGHALLPNGTTVSPRGKGQLEESKSGNLKGDVATQTTPAAKPAMSQFAMTVFVVVAWCVARFPF
jgi:hypothetical protein